MYILYLYFKCIDAAENLTDLPTFVNPLADSEPADPPSRDERIQIQGIVASKF